MDVDKANEVDPSNHVETKNISEPVKKKVNSASLIPASSHGMKLSVNMSLHDKKELLLRLEEWRKAKREKLSKGNSVEVKPAQNITCRPATAVKNKENKVGNFKGLDCGSQNEKESVFERLYKNNKTIYTKTKEAVSVSATDNVTAKPSEAEKPMDYKIENEQCHNNELKSVSNVNEKLSNDFSSPVKREVGIEEKNQNVENFLANSHFNQVKNEDIVCLTKPNLVSADSQILKIETHDEKAKSELCQETILEESEGKEKKIEKENSLGTILEENPGERKSESRKEKVKPLKKSLLPKINHPRKSIQSDILGVNSAESKEAIKPKSKAAPKVLVRRSISTLYRKKMGILRAASEKDLHKLKSLVNEKECKLPTDSFTYEDALDNKSKMFIKSEPLFSPVVKESTPSILRNKLEDWLKVNGHSLDGYRHLRCFGISHNAKKSLPSSAKKNLESRRIISDNFIAENDDDKENLSPPELASQKKEVVEVLQGENWLKELHGLIVKLKYPVERCEEWLMAIRQKCPGCTELPIYWECLAALNGTTGDIQSAIEHFETAIIKGAEVETVGNSLSELFDKMVIENQKPVETKLEKGINPKNIFKSTIIKFALQQKGIKESDQKSEEGSVAHESSQFVATPVRRSSRIHTPSKNNVVNSLQSLTPDVRRKITFKTNKSLLNMV